MLSNKNIKIQLLTFGLILIAGIITFFINSFSSLTIILFIPGLLFGLALSIPHFDKSKKQIVAITTFPIFMILLWIFIMFLGLGLGISNNSNSDNTGLVIIGLLSSLLFGLIYNQYYPVKNKRTFFILIIILGLISIFVCDYLFTTPHSKELNIGKMIFIWEISVGVGLTLFNIKVNGNS